MTTTRHPLKPPVKRIHRDFEQHIPADIRAIYETGQVPAGDYVLGDPCYSFENDTWDALLADSDFFEARYGAVEVNGTWHVVLAFGTAYGDGRYVDQQGREFPVDAGLIGLVPVAAVAESKRDRPGALGVVVTFDGPIACSNDAGDMTFGAININTRDEEEDEHNQCGRCGLDLDRWGFCAYCEDDDEQDDDEQDDDEQDDDEQDDDENGKD